MTVILLNIVLCIFLGIITFQDFKYRAIHFLLLVFVFVSGVVLSFVNNIPISVLGVTLLFIFTIVLLLWLYLSLKNKKLLNPFKRYIGLGDILFFFAIAPLFSIHNYMAFFISGMILALLFTLVYFKTPGNSSIPLAGILAAFLLLLKGFSLATDKDIFYTFNYF